MTNSTMTTTTTTTTANPKHLALWASIDALATKTFNLKEKTTIYLEGTTGRLYSFESDHSMTMDAYQGHDVDVYTLEPGHVVTSSLVQALTKMVPDLQALLDAYKGSEWNGSNTCHEDKWDLDKVGWFNQLERPKTSYYWWPSDWFNSDTDELIEQLASGSSVEDVIDSQNLGDPDSEEGCVDRQAAIEWLTSFFAEWQADQD